MATLITKNSSTASAVPAAGDLVKGELAVNVTDKKVYTKDNSAAVVKLVGSLGNQEANAVAITGGTINGTTIGATTPSTGAFTTASASSGFTGNLTGNVTGNVSGTAANVTGVVAIANGGTGLSALGTGVQSALGQAVMGSGSFVLSTSPSLTTPNLGTPSAAVLTNATGLPLTTGVTGTLGVANGGTGITAFGTGVATALGQNVTGSGGIVLATSPSLTTPNLGTPSAATLTNATGLPISTGVSGLGTGVATALGVAVGSAGAFVVNGGALGTPSSGTLTNATGLPISTGVSGLGTGVATALAVNTGSAGAFVVNGGALGTPSSGTVTNLTGTASININGTVGATTPTTGAFTTLSASGNITVSGGTANGVAYLNGSKVLTTGSALTFDGTTLTNTAVVGSSVFQATGRSLVFYNMAVGDAVLRAADDISAVTSIGFNKTDVKFYSSGSEGMRLNSTGLGIGTSSPASNLDIRGSSSRIRLDGSAASFQILSRNTADSTTNPLIFDADTYTFNRAGSTQMLLNASGNLGIGTSSPSSRLHVYSASGTAQILQDAGTALRFLNNSGTNFIQSGTALTNDSKAPLVFSSMFGVTEWMRLDTSGNLGIGTSSPAEKLQVSATSPVIRIDATAAFNASPTGELKFVGVYNSGGGLDSFASIKAIKANATSGDGSAYLSFFTNTSTGSLSEKMRITSAGDVGIGTSSPTENLTITKSTPTFGLWETASGTSHRVISRVTSAGVFDQNLTWSAGLSTRAFTWSQGSGEVMRLDASGNLGIGTSSPGSKLDVSGGTTTVNITSTTTSAGAIPKLRFNHAGNDAYSIVGGGYMAWLSSDTTERMRLDSSGNLGLGVTPNTWLNSSGFFGKGNIEFLGGTGILVNFSTDAPTMQLNANGKFSSGWLYKQNGYASRFIVNGSSGGFNWQIAPSGTADTAISFTQAMTLDASGNLGVGITSPAAKLDVYATTGTLFRCENPGKAQLNIGNGNTSTNYYDADLQIFRSGGGTERARITSGGYFKASNNGTYYGSTASYHELRQSAAEFIYRSSNTNASPSGWYVEYPNAAPNGTANEFIWCCDNVGARLQVRSNGGIANYSANNVNLSDRREKTNFAPAKSYLDTICAIPVQTFNYIDQSEDDPGLTLGVVAQDVQAVAPELVMESNWGTAEDPKMRLSIYQTDLQYALMKCIQELKAQNDDLRARVAQLEAK